MKAYFNQIVTHVKRNADVYACLVFINSFSFAYIFIFGGFFFRDYSIIFEGGLRILHGQVPYRDFYLPLGPITLYIQAFFEWIVGPNAKSMILHAAVVNSIILSSFFIWARKSVGNTVALALALLLHFFYYGVTVNPWYTHTAIFFYLFAQIIIWKYLQAEQEIPIYKLIACGLFLSMSIFSKQDVGMLGAIFVTTQLFFFSSKRFKETAIYFGAFLITMVLFVLYYNFLGDFGYWFNYGQEPHTPRLGRLAGLFVKEMAEDFRWHLILILPVIFICLKDFSKKTFLNLYIIFGLSAFSLIISQTSGQPRWTVFFVAPFIAVFLMQFFLENKKIIVDEKGKFLIRCLIFWIMVAYTCPIVKKNLHPLTFFLKKSYTKLTDSSYAGMSFPPEIIEGINKIKHELKNKQGINNKNWFLNMSSYTFLYADLGIEPPRNTHLWYHHDVTLFDKDYQDFKQRLREKPFEYILLQEMASGTPRPEFREFLHNIGYKALFSVPNPKSGVPGKSGGRGQRYQHTLYEFTGKD